MMKKSIVWAALLVILFSSIDQHVVARQTLSRERGAYSGWIASAAGNDMISVIVTLKDQANLKAIKEIKREGRIKQVVKKLIKHALVGQRDLIAYLEARQRQGKVATYRSFWVFNGLSVTADEEVIAELAARPEVMSITPDEIIYAETLETSTAPPEYNLTRVNAPALWNLGYTGQGVVVASMDTGVYLYHPDLVSQWRGGSNSWYDPYGQHPNEPTDLNGHGTWTMGVMVGRDAGGTSIGVAPNAQWIAVKIFDDQGKATTSAIHLGYQWLLDPDGNPDTVDTPHVVNNSWGYSAPGCNLEFQLDLQALLAAGILPVFSAGNTGPNGSTSVSPANNPEAFAVGAVNNTDTLYRYSARGPSACGETSTIYPEVVAPGVSIRTSDLYGLYYYATGTSLAAPHVTGGLALLLSAYPDLTAEQQRAALLNSAVDLWTTGPDNDFGYGRVDLMAALNWIQNNISSMPPTQTSTSTPELATHTPTSTATVPPPTDIPQSSPTATAIPEPTSSPTSAPTLTSTFTSTPKPAVTETSTPTATNTTSPTDTLTPTPSPTIMPSETPTLTQSPAGILFYLSLTNDNSAPVGSVSGVRDEDILSFNGVDFAMVFDGSDVGLGKLDLDAFQLIDADTILVSFNNPTTLPGVGAVDDSDILRFDATSLGLNTAGSFSMFFDGSLVGLDANSEDVDAVALLSDGSLLVSTSGAFSVPGVSGRGEDLIRCQGIFGPATTCNWSLYFDGSDVGLADNSGENVNGVSVGAEGNIYLTTVNTFSVPGVSGENEDVFVCTNPTIGSNTSCSYSPMLYFDGSLWGLSENSLDGIDLQW